MPAAQLGEDGRIGAESPANRFSEDDAEMLLIFRVFAITNSCSGIKIQCLVTMVLPFSIRTKTGRGDRLNADIGRKVSGWEKREPAGQVFFAEGKRLFSKQDERIENRAPADLTLVR